MATTDRLQGFDIGVAVKPACTVKSTGALTLASTQVVDGIAVGNSERILVADQADASENGIYISQSSTWLRSKDFDGARDGLPGTLVYVDRGTVYRDTFWVANSSSTALSLTVGTDDIAWSNITPTLAETSAGLVTATGSTVARRLDDRFAELFVNVKDHGAVGDGITDDSSAIQRAFDLVDAATYGGTVYLPKGQYLTSTGLVVGDNTIIQGEGRELTEIVLGTTDKRVLTWSGSTTNNHVELHDFSVRGTWQNHQSLGSNDDNMIHLVGYKTIHISRIFCRYSRHASIVLQAEETAVVDDCWIYYSARDGINVVSPLRGGGRFTNNVIRHCGDDCIACHTQPSLGNPPREGVLISGNIVEDSYGIKSLGAVKTVISNNILRRTRGYAIQTGRSLGFNQGRHDQLDVTVTDNIATDTFNGNLFGGGSLQAAIYINAEPPSTGAGAPDVPPGFFNSTAGSWVLPEDFWYQSNSSSTSKSGGWRLKIANNTIAQTLPNSTSWVSYGYGAPDSSNKAFLQTGWSDLDVSTGALFEGDGIRLTSGSLQEAVVSDNFISGFNDGIDTASYTRPWHVVVSNNTFRRINGRCWNSDFAPSPSTAWNLEVWFHSNNVDMDPFLEHTNRAADGSWTTDADQVPSVFRGRDLQGLIVERNKLKNLYHVIWDNANTSAIVRDNIVTGEFTEAGSTANRGVRDMAPWDMAQTYVFEKSNPQSTDYGDIDTMPAVQSSAGSTETPVATGSYHRGHVILSRFPSTGHRGWVKLNTGSSNNYLTDWSPF